MVSVDLGTSPAPPASVLEGLPRRLPLTLPELPLAAERAGGAPLPFEMAAPTTTTPLEDRLGQTRGGTEEAAYAAAIGALHDLSASLERRGLLVDGRLGRVSRGRSDCWRRPTWPSTSTSWSRACR